MSKSEMTAAESGFVRRGDIPLVAALTALTRWWEERHLELCAARGFTGVRRAHNAIFVNLPAHGMRLTQLAAAAGISKQATAELVDDLVVGGYLRREPDPNDGRAKLILWAERGLEAHQMTLQVFAEIEGELTEVLGERAMKQMRASLLRLLEAVVIGPGAAGGSPAEE